MIPDTEQILFLMREAAEAEILPRFLALADHEVSEKSGPNDLVTIADIETEKYLTPKLAALIPGSNVIGEEAVEENRGLMDALEDDAPVWIIDPIDGTMNFSKGKEKFCVMVGLVQKDEIIGGWIYDPLGKKAICAERGGGAWLFSDDGEEDRRLSVSDAMPLGEMRGAISTRFLPEDMRNHVRENANQKLASRSPLGCAGHEYMNLAQGFSEISLYWMNKPWDHVPGCLIHREAGGHNARFDGRDYRPSQLTGGILCAPDAESWQTVKSALGV